MPSTDDRPGDRLSDFTRDRRIGLVSLLAVVAGVLSAGIAWALLRLIALFTNLAYHHQLSTAAAEPGGQPWWAMLLIPMIGGLVIGFAARYGTQAIRGHGIPEAIEAILFGRSRMSLKVAVLKPLTSAIAIGTGDGSQRRAFARTPSSCCSSNGARARSSRSRWPWPPRASCACRCSAVVRSSRCRRMRRWGPR